MASNAVVLIRGKRHRKMSIMKTKKIIRSGLFVLGLILYKRFEPGKAPSLAIAKPILEVTVMLLNPAKNILIIRRVVIATAPAFLYSFPSAEVKAVTNKLTTG